MPIRKPGKKSGVTLLAVLSYRNKSRKNLSHSASKIVALGNSDISRYKELIRLASLASDDDFDRAKKQYVSRLWKPEFFLARHLAADSRSDASG